ncbi:VHS1015 protein [Vibrio phage 1]|nr:VHS1015 protein [Vibrio phage 1]
MRTKHLVLFCIVIFAVALTGCSKADEAAQLEVVENPREFADQLLRDAEDEGERLRAEERIANLVSYDELPGTRPATSLKPYSVGTMVEVYEFTPRAMPKHRCVFVDGKHGGGLYCDRTYGGF